MTADEADDIYRVIAENSNIMTAIVDERFWKGGVMHYDRGLFEVSTETVEAARALCAEWNECNTANNLGWKRLTVTDFVLYLGGIQVMLTGE